MMFRAWGHTNIKATHKTTIEFTKEEYVSPEGDCIIGIAADFNAAALRQFVKKYRTAIITIKTGSLKETIIAKTNPKFNDDKELVIRMGEHASTRTFAVRADRASKHLDREFVKALQLGSPMEVNIEAPIE